MIKKCVNKEEREPHHLTTVNSQITMKLDK